MSHAWPELFGPYRLEEFLGRASGGEVYRAYDTRLGRYVVLKRLPAPAGGRSRARLFREVEVVARSRVPHVVPIHEYGEIDGWLYLVTQLVEGTDLERELAAGPLEPQRAIGILSQVATGLDEAHRMGVVHGDIKPASIVLDTTGTAYLTDFGIPYLNASDTTTLTASDDLLSTFDYLAPERIRDDTGGTPATDVYALACVLFRCITGRVPFPAADTEGKLTALLGDRPPAPSLFDSRIPPALDRVVRTGMHKNPQRRYPTASSLMEAAEAAIRKRYGRPRRRSLAQESARRREETAQTLDLHRSDLRLAAANEQRLTALPSETSNWPGPHWSRSPMNWMACSNRPPNDSSTTTPHETANESNGLSHATWQRRR